MRAELANLNHCAVPFLSRAAVNLSWFDSILYFLHGAFYIVRMYTVQCTLYNTGKDMIHIIQYTVHNVLYRSYSGEFHYMIRYKIYALYYVYNIRIVICNLCNRISSLSNLC